MRKKGMVEYRNLMKSFFGDKTWVILLVVLAFFGLVILASGLGGMEFGQPYATGIERNNPFDFSDLETDPGSRWLRYLIPGLFLLMFLLMLGPVRPQRGNSMMNALMRALAFVLFFVLVIGQAARQGGLLAQETMEGMPVPGAGTAGPVEFAPPSLTSGWALWITLLLIVVVGVAAVFIVNRAIDRLYKPKTEINEIAEIARTALNGLSGGKETKNAIVRCYLEMNRTVEEKRGLVREAAMTPGEFASRLGAMGLPPGAVNGLTEVFERVRYGGREAGAEEIEEAKRCLTDILKACGTKG